MEKIKTEEDKSFFYLYKLRIIFCTSFFENQISYGIKFPSEDNKDTIFTYYDDLHNTTCEEILEDSNFFPNAIEMLIIAYSLPYFQHKVDGILYPNFIFIPRSIMDSFPRTVIQAINARNYCIQDNYIETVLNFFSINIKALYRSNSEKHDFDSEDNIVYYLQRLIKKNMQTNLDKKWSCKPKKYKYKTVFKEWSFIFN